MNETRHDDALPFIAAAPNGDVPVPFDEDSAAIALAIRALVRGPRGAGPVDRSAEARAVRAVAERVEALTGSDPAALRQRLALHAELANALVVIYAQRAADAGSPGAQATYAGISMRAMAVGARLLTLLGASAPLGGDGA